MTAVQDSVAAAPLVADFRLGYRPTLDGVRAIAVLAVIGFHASLSSFPGGYLGVDVFFVLSGFLITALLVQEQRDLGSVRLGHFYARRALRLFPALAVVLAACVGYALARPDVPEVEGIWSTVSAAALYVANWTYALRDGFETDLLSHTWSLGIEEQFYLLWPLVLVWVLARGGQRGALAVAVFGGVGLTVWRVVLFESGAPLPRVSFGLDTRAAALLLGAAIGLAAVRGHLRPVPVLGRSIAGVGALWLVVIVLGDRYGLAAISADPGRQLVEGILVADLAAALLIIGLLLDDGGPVAWVLRRRPIVWIGRLSYGLYLWHFPVDVIVTTERTGLPNAVNHGLRLAITAGLAIASYFVVELPCLRRKHRFERRPDLDASPATGEREVVAPATP